MVAPTMRATMVAKMADAIMVKAMPPIKNALAMPKTTETGVRGRLHRSRYLPARGRPPLLL